MRHRSTTSHGSHMSCLLRHEMRSPADLPGTEGHHAKAISSTAQVSSAPRRTRHHQSETESMLWRQLSGKKLGVAFRRQVPVGGKYVADFLAPTARLIVEIDDRTHELKRTADARRDRDLNRLGYRVLRLPAALVRCNVAEAVSLVVTALRSVVAQISTLQVIDLSLTTACERRNDHVKRSCSAQSSC
ncbi:MAG TPA: DUF559 domain-containing protein [Polyangiaceae bacterium]